MAQRQIKSVFDLVSLFNQIKTAQTAKVVTRTPLEMLKKGRIDGVPNPYLGKVSKIQVLEVLINGDYEAQVRDQRLLAGLTEAVEFKAQPRKWGVHINDAFVEYQGTIYLHCTVKDRLSSTLELDNGKSIDQVFLSQYMPAPKTVARTTPGTVDVRDIKMENVINLSIGNAFEYIKG